MDKKISRQEFKQIVKLAKQIDEETKYVLDILKKAKVEKKEKSIAGNVTVSVIKKEDKDKKNV